MVGIRLVPVLAACVYRSFVGPDFLSGT